MNELYNLIRSFGVARLAAVIGVTFGVAAAMAFIIARIGAPSMSVLYADVSYADAQPVIDQLEQNGVKHTLKDGGARVTILVPRDEIGRLRTNLAAEGLSINEGVGYEIFDNNSTLGATSFQQNINRLRALEGELARTLTTINGVRSARVHLVMPERELFARDKQTASASIVVDAPGGLDNRAVAAIVNLAASAVPSLDPTRVTVLDSRGKLLASGADKDSDAAIAGSIEERKAAAQAKIRREVENMIGRIVGADNVRVEVAADMDFSRITESSEIVDPDSQTVLSSTTVEETSSSADPASGQGVSVANGLPGGQGFAADGGTATSSSQRTEETTNYEISKTVRNAVREEGIVIKRLSVAVAVNGVTATGADGALSYSPRSAEEIARIDTLVKSAIGFNAARGDQVNVVDIQFSPLPAAIEAPAPAAAPLFANTDIMRMVEVAALTLIVLALGYFVLRPMLAPGAATETAAIAAAPSNTVEAPALTDATESALETRIDLSQVEGQVKASSINKVSEIVKAHTDESANILRGWMREAS
ncbi:MAG: flagellar M-ring protein FliF [Marinicaulis sp.]|nr:flagellar M-ring protein FliF [Marinicaulis sp.]